MCVIQLGSVLSGHADDRQNHCFHFEWKCAPIVRDAHDVLDVCIESRIARQGI